MQRSIVLIVCMVLCVLPLWGMSEEVLPTFAESDASHELINGEGRSSLGSVGYMGEEREETTAVAGAQPLERADAAAMSEEYGSAFRVVQSSLWLRRRGAVDAACPELVPAEVSAGLDLLNQRLQKARM